MSGRVRACTTQLTNGLWSSRVTLEGNAEARAEGTQHALYSANSRFFVQAFGSRFDAAMRKVLGTTMPPC